MTSQTLYCAFDCFGGKYFFIINDDETNIAKHLLWFLRLTDSTLKSVEKVEMRDHLNDIKYQLSEYEQDSLPILDAQSLALLPYCPIKLENWDYRFFATGGHRHRFFSHSEQQGFQKIFDEACDIMPDVMLGSKQVYIGG